MNDVDMIIDNKTFTVPTSPAARKYKRRCHVRGHLRLASEGLKPEYTRPGTRKNRMNTGGRVSVCAGLSNGKVAMWQYLDKRWSGEAAAELYKGPIRKALMKSRGAKVSYTVLEDGDPASCHPLHVARPLHARCTLIARYIARYVARSRKHSPNRILPHAKKKT